MPAVRSAMLKISGCDNDAEMISSFDQKPANGSTPVIAIVPIR
jgi:hypothetical protein